MTEQELIRNLGYKIRQIRLKKAMTQNELAIACEFEKASLSRLESGQTNPTVKTLHRICKVLEVDIAELFTHV